MNFVRVAVGAIVIAMGVSLSYTTPMFGGVMQFIGSFILITALQQSND